MWNLASVAPQRIVAQKVTSMPSALRRQGPSEWAAANKPGHHVDSFIEGPCFDRQGRLFLVDIPSGRVMCVDASHTWTEVGCTGGWPNGLALHPDGSLWIADYRLGILRLEVDSGRMETVLGHRNSESFKGVNDLTFGENGMLYFTDQGQTGLHDPTGRVYRFDESTGRLDALMHNVPSPNGIAIGDGGRTLFVAATRSNQVWRAPLLPDWSVSKAGAFRTFFGTSGPDGLCWTSRGDLVVAHASLGAAFVVSPSGEIHRYVVSEHGSTITNAALGPDSRHVWITESSSGSVLRAELD